MAGTSLRVRLTPRSSRSGLDRYEEGVLHARVSAPPVDGAANTALVELLAKALGVRKGAIIIVSGATSREKRVEIVEMSPDELTNRILAALAGGAG